MRLKTILFFLLTTLVLQAQMFQPGKIWKDTDGTHINAHGGGVLYHQGTYYWYGEHKTLDQSWRGPFRQRRSTERNYPRLCFGTSKGYI